MEEKPESLVDQTLATTIKQTLARAETYEPAGRASMDMRNQALMMQCLRKILSRTDDRRTQILAALDEKHPNMFSDDMMAKREKAELEEIILMYMAQWGDVAASDAIANFKQERKKDILRLFD